jgi:outer membrane protein
MVSKKKLSIVTIAVIGLLSLVSMKTFAQKIGVVDGQKVLDSYSEYKAASDKIDVIVKSWQDTLAMMQKSLQDKAEGYKKGFEAMTKDAQAKAQADLDKGQQDIYAYNNQKSNQSNGEILKVRKDLMAPIVDKVKEAISTVAKKKKLDIILDKGNVAFVSDGATDITADVQSTLKK